VKTAVPVSLKFTVALIEPVLNVTAPVGVPIVPVTVAVMLTG
jgi:hypothetical protein